MTTPTPTVAVVHFPSGGHIRPILPLVAALGQQGIRTVQWAPSEWEQDCTSAGGEFRALPDLSDLAWPSPTPFQIAEFLGALAERHAPWMTDQLADAGADLLLRDSFAQYGHYAARANGIGEFVVPAMMAFHRGCRPSPRDAPAFAKALLTGAPSAIRLRRISRRLGARYGEPLGGPLSVFAGRHGSPTFVATVPALQMRPDGLRGEDVKYIGPARALRSHAADHEPALAGIDEQDRVVYVSLGTVFEQSPDFYREAARALSAPGRRVILSIGRLDPATIEPLPEGVSAHAHVDQLAVLRRAQLFVTHCGFNRMQEGLSAGVPLLLCPQMFEQAMNADVVVSRRAGVRVRDPSAQSIAAGAARLLGDPSYLEAARRLASELRAGDRVDAAVELMAGAAAQRASRPAGVA
jgi:MGT family glycosyltransferase